MILYSAMYDEGDPFRIFNRVVTIKSHTEIQEKHAVLILWGGEDIGTSLYGEKPNKFCFSFKPSFRDIEEQKMIARAVELDIPIIGICRGAQLLCATAGGKLIQHIDGHGQSHDVTLHDESDVEITCNSSHHQMMLPGNCQHVLLASSGPTTGINAENQAVIIERVPEVIYFPTLNALAIQPHPEWVNCPNEFIDYCIRKIDKHLFSIKK